jgi:hypothetical protein
MTTLAAALLPFQHLDASQIGSPMRALVKALAPDLNTQGRSSRVAYDFQRQSLFPNATGLRDVASVLQAGKATGPGSAVSGTVGGINWHGKPNFVTADASGVSTNWKVRVTAGAMSGTGTARPEDIAQAELEGRLAGTGKYGVMEFDLTLTIARWQTE